MAAIHIIGKDIYKWLKQGMPTTKIIELIKDIFDVDSQPTDIDCLRWIDAVKTYPQLFDGSGKSQSGKAKKGDSSKT